MSTTILDRDTQAAPVRAGSRNRLRGLAVATALLAAAAGVAWFGHHWWTVGRFIESTDDAYVGGDVTVIAPNVSGIIIQVAVTDDQAVHAGDLLVKIDDRDYRAVAAKALAAIAAQRASLANLDATRQLQLAMVAQAQADIAAADAEIVVTRDDQSRYRQLSVTAAASVQSFQKADALAKEAVAAGQKAQAGLVAAERRLDVIDTQKQQIAAQLAQAQADYDLAQINVGYTELRAPIDGTIGNRSARVGGFASVGAQLLSVVPARGLWVDANFKESQLAGMHPGQSVSIQADVLPGRVFEGHVVSLAPATGAQFSVLPPENATGNFTKIVQRVPVRILLDGDSSALGDLRPGLSVTAAVDERER
jgi:membrane fusion protein, multidrug efflux system